jgi:uncharacterized coiled-coil protein SlyX
MISPEMATDIVSPYPPTMQELEKKVAELEAKVAELNNSLTASRSLLSISESNQERLRNFLVSNMDCGTDFDEAALDIANIMGFDLTREYYFDVTVRFTGTVMGSPGQDLEEFIENMHFDMDNRYSDTEFSVDDITVDNVDIDEV